MSDLMGLLMGNKMLAAGQAAQRENEMMKRAHPLPTELAAQVAQVAQNPKSFKDMMAFKSDQTPEEIDAKTALMGRQSPSISMMGHELGGLPQNELEKLLQFKTNDTPETTAAKNYETIQHGNLYAQGKASNNKEDKEAKKNEDAKNGMLDSLKDLEDTMKQIPSGPAVGRLGEMGAKWGVGPNKDAITKFQTLVTGLKMQYGKDFSGRYNNTEGAEIEKKLLPLLNLPSDQQAAALEGARELVHNKFRGSPGGDNNSENVPSASGPSSDMTREQKFQYLQQLRQNREMNGQ